jgi:hypothetical protein
MDVLTLISGTHSYELAATTDTSVLGSEIAAAAQSGGGMVNVMAANARAVSVLITPGLFVAIQRRTSTDVQPFTHEDKHLAHVDDFPEHH